MHQVCFAKSDSSVDKERIVHFSRRFGHCERGSMGKIVVAADHKSIEGVLWIQIGFFNAFIQIRSNGCLFSFQFLCFFGKDKFQGTVQAGDFRNGNPERKGVLLLNITESRLLLSRDQDIQHICRSVFFETMYLQWFQPRIEGYVCKFMFQLYGI